MPLGPQRLWDHRSPAALACWGLSIPSTFLLTGTGSAGWNQQRFSVPGYECLAHSSQRRGRRITRKPLDSGHSCFQYISATITCSIGK